MIRCGIHESSFKPLSLRKGMELNMYPVAINDRTITYPQAM